VRFYQDILLDEELTKERLIGTHKEIKLQQGDQLTLVFDEKREIKSYAKDESLH